DGHLGEAVPVEVASGHEDPGGDGRVEGDEVGQEGGAGDLAVGLDLVGLRAIDDDDPTTRHTSAAPADVSWVPSPFTSAMPTGAPLREFGSKAKKSATTTLFSPNTLTCGGPICVATMRMFAGTSRSSIASSRGRNALDLAGIARLLW